MHLNCLLRDHSPTKITLYPIKALRHDPKFIYKFIKVQCNCFAATDGPILFRWILLGGLCQFVRDAGICTNINFNYSYSVFGSCPSSLGVDLLILNLQKIQLLSPLLRLKKISKGPDRTNHPKSEHIQSSKRKKRSGSKRT
jgi:hypothetical protein